MSIAYNADEIIEIAENIERNGTNFYKRAAQIATDPKVKELLLELEEMEDNHESYFSSLKTDWLNEGSKDNFLNPEDQAHQYLQAIAGGYVFDLNKNPQDLIKENSSEKEILKIAIGFEKDALVFFMGMMEAVPEKLGKERISDLIKEEMNHVSLLSAKLVELESKK